MLSRREGILAAASIVIKLLFFFQAGDGIRGYKVTGVQTCALPISKWRLVMRTGIPKRHLVGPHAMASGTLRWVEVDKLPCRDSDGTSSGVLVVAMDITERKRTRSEERRVGKEGRSRWSPYH